MIVAVAGGVHGDVIARFEVSRLHLVHRGQIFGPVLDHNQDDPVVTGVDYEVGTGNPLDASRDCLGWSVDLILVLAVGVLSRRIRAAISTHAGQLNATELAEGLASGHSH